MDAVSGDGDAVAVAAPSKALWAAEVPRAAWMAATWWRHRAALDAAPRGDGRPVLLLPGLFNSDRSNAVMRRYLVRLGYRAEGWGLGRNLGAKTVGGDAERLIARVEQVARMHGPVTLIGVSLGGIMARLVAHERPDLVREVVTVSSPFAGSGRATNVWRAFELFTGERLDDPAVVARSVRIAGPLPVPATAIWSRSDGLVAGTICRDDACRAIEVRSSHLGVQMRPEVLLAIAEVLAER
ncbi:alpha/beta hydrolase [Sphingomonas sp. KR1UV-12]|uniref:Alpha/beta hydrolase n=1 Tax=Sphingomonas aurea TaxID=3063994 RepID=A0ABT9EL96_9SPHN|nr:alpha/beta fold hydrolase [Sphingomonas sp. KR1UV-12]MDP1027398.1 alpha/beta hydrolase [Sphingomonas sp. KR1UV-12]